MLRELARDALATLIPVDCAGCGAPGGSPCPRCAGALVHSAPYAVPGRGSAQCPVVAAAVYSGTVRSLLLAHKERGRIGLARPLGAALADAVVVALSLVPGSDEPPHRSILLVPVPSRRDAVRRRGHDSVAALATEASRAMRREGIAARSVSLLAPVRDVDDQVGLSAPQRHANVADAFAAPRARPGRPRRQKGKVKEPPVIVVVDDITTSGATLDESVRALEAAGHRVTAAVALAGATDRLGLVPASRAVTGSAHT
jgi:predicted amidophosphoribosyltransferase